MVFLNGKFLPIEEAKVPVLDRGFIFGDGVYELVPVYSRVPFRLDEHLARLERSLARVAHPQSATRAREWRDIIQQLVDAAALRGPGRLLPGDARRAPSATTRSRRTSTPTVFMMANPLVNPPQEQVERGARRGQRARTTAGSAATSSRSR